MRHLDSQWRLIVGRCLFVLVSGLVSGTWYNGLRNQQSGHHPRFSRTNRPAGPLGGGEGITLVGHLQRYRRHGGKEGRQ